MGVKMRGLVIVAAVGLFAVSSTEIEAAKKFIPLGHSDLEQTADLPAFGSEASDFNLQADIYETSNYWRKREARESDSFMKRFRSSPDGSPTNRYIDY